MGFKKLDTSTIENIRNLRMQGVSVEMISEKLGVSRPSVLKYSQDIKTMNEGEVINSIENSEGGSESMGKPRLSIDKLITKGVEEAIDTTLEHRLMGNESEGGVDLEPTALSPLNQFFGEGAVSNTITVYKVIAGTPRFIGTINQELWSSWPDFEISFRDHIQKMTLETRDLINYGNGSYLLKSGGRSRAIELGALQLPEKTATVIKPTSPVEQISDIASIIKTISEALPRSSGSEDIYKLLLANKDEEVRLLREELRALRDKDVAGELEKAISLARMVKGGGESAWITALQTFGPQIASAFEKIAGALAVGRAMPPSASYLALKANPPAPALPAQYQALFNELHSIVKEGDSSKFPHITRQLVGVFGGDDSLIKAIASGETTQAQLIEILRMYGGEPFKEAGFQDALTRFVEAYIRWTKTVYPQPQPNVPTQPKQVEQPSPYSDSKPVASAPNNTITVHCPQCHAVYDVDKNDWTNDDRVCGNKLLNGECTGILEEVNIPA